jgi:hypothetical protein
MDTRRFLAMSILVLLTICASRPVVMRAAEVPVAGVAGTGSSVFFKGQPTTVTFAFTAERDSNGAVTGQARFHIRLEPFALVSERETEFTVSVSCLEVAGAGASLGGTILESTADTPPLAVGQQVVWRVLAGGRGDGAADLISPVFGGLPAGYCMTNPDLTGFPEMSPATMARLTSGTIEVRP